MAPGNRDAVANKVGYPDRWRDYSKLEIVRGDELGNVIRARDFEFQRRLEKIGKPVGSDVGNEKATYPKFFGLDESRNMARAESAKAIAALDGFGEQADPLRGIARFIVERDL